MDLKPLLAIALLYLVPQTRAQVVADGETNLFNNITTSVSGDVTVGTNGSFTGLILTNGALLTNTGSGTLGLNIGANSNHVFLQGSNTAWRMNGNLVIGASGSFNTLLVTNGGRVANSYALIGNSSAANNNQVTVTGTNSLWTNSSLLFVGNSGSFNTLLVADGGRVADSYSYLGNLAVASNNQVIVTGSNSVWSHGSDLAVGYRGSFNTVLITNGGGVANRVNAYLGYETNSHHNQVIVTGPGSLWTNGWYQYVGYHGSFNTLLITNGGRMVNFNGTEIGSRPASFSNQVIVTGSNSTWDSDSYLAVGFYGSCNSLLLSEGAQVRSESGFIGFIFCSNNQATVTGPDSVWTSTRIMGITGAGGNTLLITNGGRVVTGDGVIGATNNQVIVTGPNSLWANSGNLDVGYDGVFNTLLITNAGVVQAFNAYVGSMGGFNNLLSVEGSTLTVTNATNNGVLDVRHGSTILNSGTLSADRLLLTNSAGTFTFNAGTMHVRSATVANDVPFTVGNGTSAATYHLSGTPSNIHSFANQLIITNNATLTGNGLVNGLLTVAGGGTLAPGTSIGRIVLETPPVLQGSVVMKITRSGPVWTNDQIQAVALTYGGSLAVAQLGSGVLVPGDSFRLFNATSYSGAFSSIALPPLFPGLSWTNKLLVDGSIAVVTKPAPRIGKITVSGASLSFEATGGPPNGGWNLLTSTDVALPLADWITTRSGVFDWLGNVTLTNAIDFTEPFRFFLINVP